MGQVDLLEEEMATHSSIPAWETPWAEEPGGLQSMGGKIVDLQCCVSFRCITFESITHTYNIHSFKNSFLIQVITGY